jgi:hypothetical protein
LLDLIPQRRVFDQPELAAQTLDGFGPDLRLAAQRIQIIARSQLHHEE